MPKGDAIYLVEEFSTNIRRHPEVSGICLLGGLGYRNTFDQHSDIDIAIFLSRKPQHNFLPPFSFKMNYKDFTYEFNVSQLLIEEEYDKNWPLPKLEAYSKARIIFDKDCTVINLIQKKYYSHEKFKSRAIDCLNQFNWKVNTHAIVAYERGNTISSHLLINEGIMLLIDSIYCINNSYMPHTKWCITDLSSLKFLPPNLIAELHEILLVQSLSIQDINRRIIISNNIYKWINQFVRNNYNINEIEYYKYWAIHLSERQIFQTTFFEEFVDSGIFSENEMAYLESFFYFHSICNKEELLTYLNFNTTFFNLVSDKYLLNKIKMHLDK